MKKTHRTKTLRAGCGVLGLGAALAASAGTVTIDFNTDPSLSGLYQEVGATSSEWRQDGGATGANGDGYLSVTDARGGQRSVLVFKDLEPGLVVKAFTFECDMRIGGGRNQPADGFSLNYVRASDPIIDNGSPFAGTGTETDLPEEGSLTGLGIGFDTWKSGDVSAGVVDCIGISIRVDGNMVAQLPVPLQPGNVYTGTGTGTIDEAPYRNLATNDVNYAKSMQTGALSNEDLNGDGVVDAADELAPQPAYGDPTWGLWIKNLAWAHFVAELTENSTVKITWKGVEITPTGGLPTTFSPSPGRLVFGGRTGGNWEATHVDNIKLTTVAADTVIVSAPTGLPVGFRIGTIDSGPAIVDLSTAKLTFDGVDVTPIQSEKNGLNGTLGWWDATKPLVIGSTHGVVLSVKDTRGIEVTKTNTFTVPNYVTVPPAYAVTGVDTSKKGFSVKIHQTADRNQETTVARAEQQLAGLRGANVADLSQFPGGGNVWTETGTINYSQLGTAGVPEPNGAFKENLDDPTKNFPDVSIPGIPSATEVNADGTIYTDNIAAEITTYINFPEAGVYTMIFNSDDGFRTTTFSSVHEVLSSLLVSQADVGKGASDVAATLYVPQAGNYPFRTVWFEGGGGANLEWSAQELAPTATDRWLINEPTQTQALKAYSALTTGAPACVSFVHPFLNSGNPYFGDAVLQANLEDGATPVDQGSIKMLLNGTEVAATKSKTGTTTKVTFDPPGNLPANSTNQLVIRFTAGTQTYDATNSFTVANTIVVPPSLALPASAVDKSKTGFLVKTVQHGIRRSNADPAGTAEDGMPNSIYRANTQLAGLWGWPNTADTTLFTGPGGYFEESTASGYAGVINYNGISGDGGFFTGANGYPDSAVPGMPGTALAESGVDNYSQEILTVLDLQPGIYVMDVNSDDNAAVYVGNPKEWMTLPILLGMYGSSYESDSGRGVGTAIGDGTRFSFEIKTAGLYPFRLVWEQGGGGHGVEWSTREESNGFMTWYSGTTPLATLVGDSLTAGAIKAYEYPISNAGAPYVKSFAPGRSTIDSAASKGRVGPDATVTAVLDQAAGTIDTTSVAMTINGTAVTPTATKSGSLVTVTYKPAGGFAAGSTNAVALTFGDRTVSWTFIVGLPATPVFSIEAADFDYNGGQSKPEASVMPYMGGAYAGLSAVAGTDYNGPNTVDNPYYRYPSSLNVPVSFGNDRDRGLGEVVADFRLGWMGEGKWFNYTRTFPAGTYNVYAALSHGDATTTATRIGGSLVDVTGGGSTVLGAFDAPTTGGWGNNALVPMKDAATTNSIVALDLSGTKTLRFNDRNGDFDYLLFAPAVNGEVPQFTSIKKNADGSITVEWTGGGTLQAAPAVTGPWQDVTGATSPYTLQPTEAMLYDRIKQ